MGLIVDIKKRLKGFTLNVKFEENNEVLGLLGSSGAGKSMTLRCIAGIDTPHSGRIILNGRVLFDSEKKINLPIRERKVGFLFQNYALFPHINVEENIGFGLQKNIPEKEKQDIINKKIEDMHLKDMGKRYPFELSGGQQQRVALARALVVEPEILLLDEPFSALDEHLRSFIINQFKDDISGFSGTTVFVTHNREEAYELCKNIIILSEGRVNTIGNREDIFNTPSTLESAKLTGCKNISRAKKINSNSIEAIDWNCTLTLDQEAKNNLSYAGIRAHYLELAGEDGLENTFTCFPAFISESLFRVKVYLKLNSEPACEKDYDFVWDISKEEWSNVKYKSKPWKIRINPKKIFLIYE